MVSLLHDQGEKMEICFLEILRRLKEVIQRESNMKKIYDRDVANALGLDSGYFAVIKRRNKIPYEAIALFCHKHRINMTKILFGKNPSKK